MKLCVICQEEPVTGNNPFCIQDKREHDALKKDAYANDRGELYEKAKLDPVLMGRLIADYRSMCSVSKSVNGWERPSYD